MTTRRRPVRPLGHLALARTAVDRAALRRTDQTWLAAAWDAPSTRVIRLAEDKVRVSGDPPELAFDGPRDAAPAERIFLGVDDDGVAYFAVQRDTADPDYAGLREVGAVLNDRDAGLLVNAVALTNWHATHQRCPRCGTPTEVVAAGHLRRCPADGSEHYPRTDPAVIMAVVDEADRILLGSQSQWANGRYSTLAGFVEPGESLEAAVRREVAEEVGVTVGEVHYLGSQPWPFPSSLMLGFVAFADTVDIELRDGEIAVARWFSRGELLAAVQSGDVKLSPPVSIARRLIESWYGDPLPDAPPG